MLHDLTENPFLHALGVKIREWEQDRAELVLLLQAWHLNRQGTLQGGLITTLLDAACGYAGLYSGEGQPLHASTISLSVNFIGTVREGAVHAVGTRCGGGRRIFFAHGNLYADNGSLVATAQASFRYRAH